MKEEARKLHFEKVWEEKIKPALFSLAEEKNKAKKMFRYIACVPAAFFLGFILFPFVAQNFILLVLSIIVFIGLIAFLVKKIIENKSDIYKKYKEEIYAIVLKETKFGWQFVTQDKKHFWGGDFMVKEFKESSLYSRLGFVYSDDAITAKYKDVDITASEIEASRTTQGSDGKQQKVTIFDGFFARINLDKSFKGETYVGMKGDINAFILGESMDISKSNTEEVNLEWNDFENFLEIRSTDQAEAREIFAPDFMAVIYDWWVLHKANIRFVFKGKNIYISIPTKMGFDANVFAREEKEKQIIEKHLELLWFIEEIVEMLLYHQRLKLD